APGRVRAARKTAAHARRRGATRWARSRLRSVAARAVHHGAGRARRCVPGGIEARRGAVAGQNQLLGAGGGALSPALGRTLIERARTWAVGSDPGLRRLQLAIRTTIALGVVIEVRFLLVLWIGAA